MLVYDCLLAWKIPLPVPRAALLNGGGTLDDVTSERLNRKTDEFYAGVVVTIKHFDREAVGEAG